MKNYYPQFSVIPFKPTTVQMPLVVTFAKTLIAKYGLEVVKAAYIIFRIEGANGLKGVNDNYIGLQSDCGVWEGLDLTNVVGVCEKVDSGAVLRGFICFNTSGYQTCFDFLCYKVKERGMYIGAPGVGNADQIDVIYKTKWNGSTQPPNIAELHDFESLYRSATIAFG